MSELRPACTRGTNLLAAPGPRLPANWGCAASRRARVGNRAPRVHAGLAFRHPPVPQGASPEPRPACTRGTRLLARARPRHPSGRQETTRWGGPMPETACRVYTRDAVSGDARQPAGGAGRAGGPRQARTGGRPVQPWPVLSLSDPRRSVCPRSARLLGTPLQSAACGAINLQTLAANSRSEHSHPDSAAMEGWQGGLSSCRPAISQAMAANPRCEHSYPSPAANQVRNDGQMAASSRRECSLSEVAATLQGGRCPLGPSTCCNAGSNHDPRRELTS